MSAIKKFFQKRKLDVKFKRAGEGHKLADEGATSSRPAPANVPSTSKPPTYQRQQSGGEEAKRAAAAALVRSQQNQKVTPDSTMAAKARMRRELELEKKKEQDAIALAQRYADGPQEVVKDTGHDTPILFKCPEISPVVLPKDEMEAHIHEFLLAQLAEEPEMTTALMIHTLNKDKEKVKVCIETLCKYLDNIINNPGEEKFRKIRLSNKAFKERITALEGTEEFLQAAGFMMKMLPFEDHEEHFYVMEDHHAIDIDRLKNLKEVLTTAEPIKPQLDRALRVFHASNSAEKFSVPVSFYSISPEELKKEQKRKQEAVETLGMLRTKAMRERDERREIFKYRYTLLRVRFPDGVLIQGTFKASEKLSALFLFIRENLANDWMPFQLCTPTGTKLNEETKMFAELGLTPAALINFEWDKSVMADVTAQQGSSQQTSALKPEIMEQIQDFY